MNWYCKKGNVFQTYIYDDFLTRDGYCIIVKFPSNHQMHVEILEKKSAEYMIRYGKTKKCFQFKISCRFFPSNEYYILVMESRKFQSNDYIH